MARPFGTVRRRTGSSRWLALAACLLMAACSGIEPISFPDERENPTFPGLFTGKQGEWVIYREEEE